MSLKDAQSYVHDLETQLNRNLTDVSSMEFFDLQDYINDLEKEISHKRKQSA